MITKPSTLLRFHNTLKKRKYQWPFSPRGGRKSGHKGPSADIIHAIAEMKRRNPRFGYPRIAQQVNLTFGVDINKDTAPHVLAAHYKRDPSNRGPSWLTTMGHAKDSLWSVDLFRCGSIVLKSHWVMVVMDQCTRRTIDFGAHAAHVDGPILSRMFNEATSGKSWPTYLSSDNDPLFQYHRWTANMRILDIEEIKSLPYAPMSHPFVERLIGSVRRELLDQTLFWTANDLENKLREHQCYFNESRTHSGLGGITSVDSGAGKVVDINHCRWKRHCRGLFELPIAA